MPNNTEAVLKKAYDVKGTEKNHTILGLFSSPRLAKNTIMLVCCWSILLMIYMCLTINVNNLGGNPFLNYLFQAVGELPAYMIGKYVSDHYGRRWTSIISFILTSLACVPIIFVINGRFIKGFPQNLNKKCDFRYCKSLGDKQPVYLSKIQRIAGVLLCQFTKHGNLPNLCTPDWYLRGCYFRQWIWRRLTIHCRLGIQLNYIYLSLSNLLLLLILTGYLGECYVTIPDLLGKFSGSSRVLSLLTGDLWSSITGNSGRCFQLWR